MSLRPRALALVALLLGSSVAGPSLGQAAAGADDRTAEARAHFDKGLKLLADEAWGAALAEFLTTRSLAPTVRNATINAARCLTKLERYDEALAMYEALLREFPDLPEEDKSAAQREVIKLRALVGTLEVEGAELGATIAVDGRARGDHPLLAPLRVGAGSHMVRVFKSGFEPFEQRVDVAGGRTVRVVAQQSPLTQSGRLRVTEQTGRAAMVIVDGYPVGVTPWEGPLPPGDHTVALRGDGTLGSQPVSVPVRLGQTAPLGLVVEELEASLRVQPTPVNALVSIDGVTIGRGVFEVPLRVGTHKVEVAAEGFVASTEDVRLARGDRHVVAAQLSRDLGSPLWRRPARFVLEVQAAGAFGAGLGGDVAGGCDAACSTGPALGGHGTAALGYQLGSGLGFGVSAGYAILRQVVTARAATVQLVDPSPSARGTADDTLTLSGLLAGGFVGLALGDATRLHLRLGAGALLGSVRDTRTGVFTSTSGLEVRVDGARAEPSATLLYVAPDVRVGFPVGAHAQLTLGVGALVLVAPSAPTWQNPREGVYGSVSRDVGYFGAFREDALLGRVLVSATPELGLRYEL